MMWLRTGIKLARFGLFYKNLTKTGGASHFRYMESKDDTPISPETDNARPSAKFYASVEDRLAAQQRRKRARLRFTITALVMGGLISWMASDMLIPDVAKANLSAKPAPSNPVLSAQLIALAPMQRDYESDALGSGDTLAALLTRANVNAGEAGAALDQLRSVYDVRRLKPGQSVRIHREWPAGQDKSAHEGRFAGFDFIPVPEQKIIVRRTDHQSFTAIKRDRLLTDRHFLSDSLINSSVYEAARGGGMSPNLVVELIRLFSFAIDFQRDIREGDQLEVLYTRRFDANNQVAQEGDIIFAALTNRGKRYAYWRMPQADGSHSYFDANGQSVQRLLMRTPVDGARLSSRFGMRRHPILGYTRLHRGLDFAAPKGTPIYAAGDGTIQRLGRFGNNGKYIRIKHRNGYETAYAHMNSFARRLKKGSRVKQGQVIGTVGRTGLATGPHLHYEVLHYNKPVNPRELNVPPQRNLNADALEGLARLKAETADRVSGLATSDNSVRSLPRRSSSLNR
jgi:murein DD-endopeptidase MepM/ murein hydrolase activator NlpD